MYRMSESYNPDDCYEPPSKKIKYECELIQFDVGYLTKDNEILILENKYENTEYISKFYKPILHFQTVDFADIYMIGNLNNNNNNNIDNPNITDNTNIIDINKGYTLDEIFNYFIKGMFSIGLVRHFDEDTKKGIPIIKEIYDFDHESNSEIKLHYTTNRQYEENVAWRSINWDLFSEFTIKY